MKTFQGSGNQVQWEKIEGMFSLEKRRLRWDMLALFKHLKGWHMEEGKDLSSPIPEYITRSNGLKVGGGNRSGLNTKKNFLTVKSNGVSYWKFSLAAVLQEENWQAHFGDTLQRIFLLQAGNWTWSWRPLQTPWFPVVVKLMGMCVNAFEDILLCK